MSKRDNALLVRFKEQQNMLPDFDKNLLFCLERRYLDVFSPEKMDLCESRAPDCFSYDSDIRLFKVAEINYNGDVNFGLHLLNFQNILAAMNSCEHSIIQIVKSDGKKISLYYGIAKSCNSALEYQSSLSVDQMGKVFGDIFSSNYYGTNIIPIDAPNLKREILPSILGCDHAVAFPGIPTMRLKNDYNKFGYSQGLERFIDAMQGRTFVLMTISEPMLLPNIDDMIGNLFNLSSDIHSCVKANVTKTKGSSDSFNIGMFGMQGNTSGQSVTESTTNADTYAGPGMVMQQAGGLGGLIGAGIGND